MTYATLCRLLCMLVLAVMLGMRTDGAQAQASIDGEASGPPTFDKHLLDGIYHIQSPAFRGVMRVAGATAFPVYLGWPAVAWLSVWAVRGGGDWSDAYRLTLSEMGTLGATVGLKYLVRRPRPFVRLRDIEARSPISRWDPYSFPSGHTSVAFALVTSWTLSHPRWYVAAPGYLWATSVAVSRVWQGVHYPSDILFGALLGSAVAWGAHALGDTITPAVLRKDDDRPAMPVIHLRIPLF